MRGTTWIVGLALLLPGLVVLPACQEEEEAPPPAVENGAEAQNVVTAENLARVEDGMTLEQVQEILGPGTEVASATMPTVDVQMGDIDATVGGETHVYQWREDGRTITIRFADGKVVQKLQAGM